MENPYDKIIKLLEEKGIGYEIFEHEPVYTSEEAAKVRGGSIREGAKSLLLKADDNFVLAIIPGDKKLDNKKIKKFFEAKSVRFAKPEEVKKIMGCEIGACYPFGKIAGVRMIADSSFTHHDYISFNPGVHNKTIKMKWSDYEIITAPEIADIATMPEENNAPIISKNCYFLKIRGMVQGVIFRDSAKRRADALGLKGFVKNCEDGTVEAVIKNGESEEAIIKFIKWAEKGPLMAKVDDVEIGEIFCEEEFADFSIR